jgi:dihydrofolate reductase
MRKLKLQMQMSVEGYIAGPNGEMDWMVWNWDDELKDYVIKITAPVDTIVLGRKMAEGFIPHWAAQATNPSTDDDLKFARMMDDTKKVVFSKTLVKSKRENTTVENDLVGGIEKLKKAPGSDIIVYGGGTFVSSLIQAGLIDEFYLFVNPAALGDGMTIFKSLDKKQLLTLVQAKAFDCGIALLYYQPTPRK